MRAAVWALGYASIFSLLGCSDSPNVPPPGPQSVDAAPTNEEDVRREVASLPLKKELWNFPLRNRIVTRMTLGIEDLYVETNDNHLICIDRFKGTTRWEWINPHDTPLDWAPVEAMTEKHFAAGVEVHSVPEEIAAFEAELARVTRDVEDEASKKPDLIDFKKLDGIKKHRTEIRQQLNAAISNDNIYIISRHILYCLERRTNQELWYTKLPFTPAAQPWATRGFIFIPSADRARIRMLSVDQKGEEMASFRSSLERINDVHNRVVYEPTILYFTSHDGGIYSWDAEKVEPHWSYKTNGEIKTEPSLFFFKTREKSRNQRDNKIEEKDKEYKLLLVGGMDRGFYCFDGDSGKLLWKYNLPGEVRTPAIGKGGTIYVRSDLASTGETAYLHAFDPLPMHIAYSCPTHPEIVNDRPIRCSKTGCNKELEGLPSAPWSLGRLRWQIPKIERFLQRFKNFVLLMGPNQKLVKVDEATGKILGEYQTNYLKFFLTNTADEIFYCATQDGNIFALQESKERF